MIKKIKTNISKSIKNKRVNVFFIFLLLAFIILIFTKLSKEYTKTVAFNINKVNVPQENIILNDSSAILNITLKTHGFKWLRYYFTNRKVDIDFVKDVDKRDSVFVWDKSKAYLMGSTQFGKQVELLNISPDTILFRYDVNLVKKIPVILNADVKYAQGFDASKAYIITPDSIEVIGPKILVDTIRSINTEELLLKEVKSNINEKLALQLPENTIDLKFSNTSVNLSATIEKFTEGTLKIPVTIKNVPASIKLKYFPKVVNVTYYTSLDNFKTVAVKDFKVECDYAKISDGQTFLIPELTQSSELVKNVKINQQHIEFIITE